MLILSNRTFSSEESVVFYVALPEPHPCVVLLQKDVWDPCQTP